MGSGCGTAVEHIPAEQTLEVVGSNPANCWAFFFSILFLIQVPHGGATPNKKHT